LAASLLVVIPMEADTPIGLDRYVDNAQVIALVNAADGSRDANPADSEGPLRLYVREVLKGIYLQPGFTIRGAKLRPGQTAVLLLPCTRGAYEDSDTRPRIWVIREDGSVDTGDTFVQNSIGEREEVSVEAIRTAIKTSTPEEIGISRQVLDSLLFPERARELRRTDFGRAQYVSIVSTIRDLPRDVGVFAGLLESRDEITRERAADRLKRLSNAPITRPAGHDPSSLAAWSEAWLDWWRKEEAFLQWNEAAGTWTRATDAGSNTRRWPTVPESLQMPSELLPLQLMDALRKHDEIAFGRAFRAWIDSGAIRDHEMIAACNLLPGPPMEAHLDGSANKWIRYASHLEGACHGLGFLPPAPRLIQSLVWDSQVPLRDRFYVIALLTSDWHYDRFVEERAAASHALESAGPCSEDIRRAAFWEPRDMWMRTPAGLALDKLANCHEEAAGALILSLFLQAKEGPGFAQIETRLRGGDEFLATGLLEAAVGDSCDDKAKWALRVLAVSGDSRSVPPLVLALESPDPECRRSAAWNLSEIPAADAVPALLKAALADHDPAVRDMALLAVAQTGDPRALDVLLAAAVQPKNAEMQLQAVRGLGRIRNPEALPALAAIAQGSGADPGVVMEAVNSFGYISGLFKSYRPAPIRTGTGIDSERLKTGLAAIAAWSKSNL